MEEEDTGGIRLSPWRVCVCVSLLDLFVLFVLFAWFVVCVVCVGGFLCVLSKTTRSFISFSSTLLSLASTGASPVQFLPPPRIILLGVVCGLSILLTS